MSDARVVSRGFTVKVPNGLHLRPWMQFVKLTQNYRSKIEVLKEFARCDGRSVMSLLALAVKCGDEIVVECQGDDAEQAATALIELLEAYVDIEDTQ